MLLLQTLLALGCQQVLAPNSIESMLQKTTLENAISYSQTQEGYLDEISSALDRMSELAMFALDGTKTDADRSLYDKEFQQLDDFISAVKGKDFNGISLFQGTTVLSVTISDSGLTTGG